MAELKRIGEIHQASPAQIAAAWAITKGTLPIIGVTKTEQGGSSPDCQYRAYCAGNRTFGNAGRSGRSSYAARMGKGDVGYDCTRCHFRLSGKRRKESGA